MNATDPSSGTERGGLTLMLAVVGMTLPTLVTWGYFVALSGAAAVLQLAAYGVGKTAQFALPPIWLLTRPTGWPRWRWGPATGVVEGAAVGMCISGIGWLLFQTCVATSAWFAEAQVRILDKVAGLGIASPATFLAVALFYSALHSALEEIYWRWFVFGALCRVLTPTAATGLSGLAFAAHHVVVLGIYFGFDHPATWTMSLAVAVGGWYWAWLYHRSGSLVGPWVSHALVDAGIFAIGYQLVGGGA